MGTVWDRATEFLGDNIAVLMPIALFAIFLPLSINDNLGPLAAQAGPGGSGQALAISLIGLAVSIISLVGRMVIMVMALDGDQASGSATRLALARLPLLLLVVIVLLLIFVVLASPIFVAIGLAQVDMKALGSGNPQLAAAALNAMGAGYAWFISLYAIAWLVAAIWLSARFALVMPIVLAERLGLGSLTRSFRLTRGIAFKIIGMLLLYIIIFFVAILAARAVFGSLAGLLIGPVGPLTMAGVITSIAVGLVQTLFLALQVAFVAKLYLAARQRGGEDAASPEPFADAR